MKNPFTRLTLALGAVLFAVAASAQSIPKIQLQPVFSNLKMPPRPAWLSDGISFVRPVWMSEAPDGSQRLFVVVQTGHIYIVKKGSDGSDAKEFFNIESKQPQPDNECGLLSIAFHPGFKTNGLFYVYYNQRNPADQNSKPLNYPFRSVVSEFKVSATDPDQADLSSERILLQYQQPFGNHKGGELAFGPDGYLYLGTGDGGQGDDPFNSGQNTGNLLGKMLRIDVNSRTTVGAGKNVHKLEYGFPPDNPFINEPDMGGRGARHEIYAYGFRNIWRYSWDRKTGDLWAGDIGQNLWEEIDLVVKGGNYGWCVREATHHFKPGPEGAKYIDPVMEYPHKPNMASEGMFPDHSAGLCDVGGYVYRGKKYPSLEGIYIYGDYNLGTIWGFRYDRDAKKVTSRGTMLDQKNLICSFAEDNDGELYVLFENGTICQLTAP